MKKKKKNMAGKHPQEHLAKFGYQVREKSQ
jgi:hypothetical protein